jgi:outer membrane protein OmpA-like peptidoglycan-associated protein
MGENAGMMTRMAVSALLLAFLVAPRTQDAQETEMPGITARLAYARQSAGILRVGVLLRNATATQFRGKAPILYAQAALLDAKTKKKQFILKDAKGHLLAGPTSDWGNGGRWTPLLDPTTDTLFWMDFDAVPPGSKVSIQIPMLQPFDDVAVEEGAATAPAASSVPPLQASVVSATRGDGQVKVRIKILNPGKGPVSAGRNIYYEDVSLFDPQTKTLYSLMKDTEGTFVAQPVSDGDHGGRWFLQKAIPGQTFMNLTFQAPPDSVSQVDVIIPWFAPLEGVTLSGAGGATSGGTAVEAKSLDIAGALKDLHAEVTDQQIKVNLAADLLFDFNQADIKPAAEPSLDKLATVLKSTPGAKVRVEGHTDGKGSDAYNQPLSEQRARNVAQWLTTHANLTAGAVQSQGFGKTKPIAPNTRPDGTDDPDGRAKNRRVEIIITRQ